MILVVVALLAAGLFVLDSVSGGPDCRPPPTADDEAAQEALVRTHLPDASAADVTCTSAGSSVLITFESTGAWTPTESCIRS